MPSDTCIGTGIYYVQIHKFKKVYFIEVIKVSLVIQDYHQYNKLKHLIENQLNKS